MSRSAEPFEPQPSATGARFEVRVAPRASRQGVLGVHAGALKVGLHAAPVDGAANAALVELLAQALGVARADVRIVRGERSRQKTIEVSGVQPAEVAALARREPSRP